MSDNHWAKLMIKDFIEQNWRAFENYCSNNGVNADEVLDELDKSKFVLSLSIPVEPTK